MNPFNTTKTFFFSRIEVTSCLQKWYCYCWVNVKFWYLPLGLFVLSFIMPVLNCLFQNQSLNFWKLDDVIFCFFEISCDLFQQRWEISCTPWVAPGMNKLELISPSNITLMVSLPSMAMDRSTKYCIPDENAKF